MDTYYKVENPIKEDISIMVKGVHYTLPSEGSLDMIPEAVAKHWESLHAFLKFEKMKSVPVSRLEAVIPTVEEKVEEVVDVEEEVMEEITEEPAVEEAVMEEVVEEKPVKKGKK